MALLSLAVLRWSAFTISEQQQKPRQVQLPLGQTASPSSLRSVHRLAAPLNLDACHTHLGCLRMLSLCLYMLSSLASHPIDQSDSHLCLKYALLSVFAWTLSAHLFQQCRQLASVCQRDSSATKYVHQFRIVCCSWGLVCSSLVPSVCFVASLPSDWWREVTSLGTSMLGGHGLVLLSWSSFWSGDLLLLPSAESGFTSRAKERTGTDVDTLRKIDTCPIASGNCREPQDKRARKIPVCVTETASFLEAP